MGMLFFYTDDDGSFSTMARQLSKGRGWGRYLAGHFGLLSLSLHKDKMESDVKFT